MTTNSNDIARHLADDCGSPYPEEHAKAIAEAMEQYASIKSREEAIGFAEWAGENGWEKHVGENTWFNRMGYVTEYNTNQLYDLKNQQP